MPKDDILDTFLGSICFRALVCSGGRVIAIVDRPLHIIVSRVSPTLIETAKLNGVDPQAWLPDILGRIADHKITRLDELTPWRYAQT